MRNPTRWMILSWTLIAPAICLAEQMKLSELDVTAIQQDWGKPHVGKSVDDKPLAIGGKPFADGIGSHAASTWYIELAGKSEHFSAKCGVDDEVSESKARAVERPLEFRVSGDGKLLFNSGPMKVGDAARPIDVDVKGVKTLLLEVLPITGENTYGHCDWVDGSITYSGEKPKSMAAPVEQAVILTPKPAPAPRINGAMAFGVRPGHPVLYTIAATGERPMAFSAQGLPPGVALDDKTGRLTGSVAKAGEFVVELGAKNKAGEAHRKLKLVVGDRIALTPPMGWNSWNCFASDVSQEKVQAAADAMVSSGLIEHGWTYINVDDCWEVPVKRPDAERRAADGTILTNKKFPSMKGMADYIHAKGLRAGLYSSPGPGTCGGFTACYGFEEKDAKSYADWGFDYLKYDWCSYGGIAKKLKPDFNDRVDIAEDQRPYKTMRDALAKQNRDILYSFCQYGMGDVWKWGDECGGNCWRTTGDITDTWRSMAGIGFSQDGHEKFAGPGHWNDPDMLVVGKVGWGPRLHSTRLTPNEQYTHISMWCLLSSPLLIGCDMTQMDEFTLSLLTNDEVLAVNQDALGKPAGRVAKDGEGREIWARDLEDGSKAVGLFNRGETETVVPVKAAELGLKSIASVHDLWRQKDVPVSSGEEFTATVPRHGVVMVRVVGK